jgi:hypothetical protein
MRRMQLAEDRENPGFVCLEFDDLRLPHIDQDLNAVRVNGDAVDRRIGLHIVTDPNIKILSWNGLVLHFHA